MTDEQNEAEERPCLHCQIVELIENYFEEYPASSDEQEPTDTDEVITALAKTVAELTYGLDTAERQDLIDHFLREVTAYDAEYREQEQMGGAGSRARH